MTSPRHRRDAGPTVFGWDEEPANERPSEFQQSTLGGPASGYYRAGSVLPVPAQRRRSRGPGWIGVLVFVVVLIGLVWAGLRWLVPLLHR